MNQRFWIGLSAALSTVMGTTLSGDTQPLQAVSIKSKDLNQAEVIDRSQAPNYSSELPTLDKSFKKRYYSYYRRESSGSGRAFWYGADELSTARPKLPFGTLVRETNLNNDRSIMVQINNRDRFPASRVIDTSSTAAVSPVETIKSSVTPVHLDILDRQ